ncbi:MAG: AMP-binding protein [Acetobacteraceae bacterium]|nr:AMP-binding protein [Acetobacteraceae bacterium]
MLGLNLDYPLLLSTIIEHAAANFADTPIVSCSRGETVRTDYRTAAARARRLGSSLRSLGVETGGFVGSLAWNTHRHFELFYGASGIGAVLHTANPRLPPDQIIYTINFTGYRTLFIDADTILLAEQLAPRLEHIDHFVVMTSREDIPATKLPNVLCYEDSD